MAIRSKTIETKRLTDWRAKMYYITYEDVSKEIGISAHTIGNAIRTGIATEETINKMSSFFSTFKLPA